MLMKMGSKKRDTKNLGGKKRLEDFWTVQKRGLQWVNRAEKERIMGAALRRIRGRRRIGAAQKSQISAQNAPKPNARVASASGVDSKHWELCYL